MGNPTRYFDQGIFSLIRANYPTERGRIKAIREIGNVPIEATLRRLMPDEYPKEQLPKGRNARRRAYKRAKRQASNTN